MTFRGHTDVVRSVAFSIDGEYIVSGSRDKTVKLWSVSSGSEIMTFRGHAGYVLSVCLSPGGRQIVSAGAEDRTVKIWDTRTGGEIMNLAHPDGVYSAAFSPDGTRIVTGCRDGRVRLWHSAAGAELLTLTAGSLVYDAQFSPDGKTIVAGIGGGDLMLWESATPAGGYEPRGKAEIGRRLVENLYDKRGFYRDVISELQSDAPIDSDIRRLAIQMADSRKWEDADNLQRVSFEIVSLPDDDTDAYKSALEKAQRANALEPNDAAILNALGSAQYRLGTYEDALKTLARSAKILSAAGGEPDPSNVAFTAMALHKIGQLERAKGALKQLRELCENEEYIAWDMQVQALLAEAEGVVLGEKK
jgi:dipeptidyl aminopeptidase/acylaminoacyl peptidase